MAKRVGTIAAAWCLLLVWPTGALAQRPAPGKKPADRGSFHLSGTYRSTKTTVDSTVNFSANLETGTFSTKFPVKAGQGIEAGAHVRVWKRLGIGLALTGFSVEGKAEVTASVPHPFFFKTPRAISGTETLERKETAVHIRAVFLSRPGRKLQFTGFAGPVSFSVRQRLVDNVNYSEAYPFDTATYTNSTTRLVTTSRTGFGIGGDATYFFTRNLGASVSALYSKAEFSLKAADDSAVAIKAGGAVVGLGLRLRF